MQVLSEVFKYKYMQVLYTGKSWQGKHWRTIQVRGIGEEKIGKSVTVSAYAKYTFGVSVNNGKEKFGK